MENTSLSRWGTSQSRRFVAVSVGTLLAVATPLAAIASSWDPTLLVNTESFQTIDDGDGTTAIELKFGDTADEILRWTGTGSRFEFTDDVHIEGNITGSGTLKVDGDIATDANLTINEDQGAVDASITFGNAAGNETITYDNADSRFEFSSGASLGGHVDVDSLQVDDITNCEVVVTDSSGRLQCASANFLDQAEADSRYINTSGDTMTGALNIINGAGINAQGAITTSGGVIINDQGAGDATLTFGGPVTQTITYSAANSRFEFSSGAQITGQLDVTGDISSTGDVEVAGDVSVQGTLSGTSLTVDSGTVNINGVNYSFTDTQGGAGTVLTNDGAGSLTWSNSALGNGSGTALSIHPEYPNAAYTSTGASSVGQLRVHSEGLTAENYYRWSTSRTADQFYDIAVRMKVPVNFNNWEQSDSIALQYRTNTAVATDNFVQFKVYDTAGTLDYESGQLTSTSFATWSASGSDLGGTYTPNGYMTVRITVMADSGDSADVGYLNFNWETTTP